MSLASLSSSEDSNVRIVTREELARHNNEKEGRWILIGNDVLDVSTFIHLHPGGAKIIADVSGTDATEAFWALHRQEVLVKWADRLRVGKIEGYDEDDDVDSLREISNVPYAEHAVEAGFESPYYTDSHVDFRERVREWVYDTLYKSGIAEKMEESGEKVPDELCIQMGKVGVLAGRLGPGKHLKIWAKEVAKDESATIFGVGYVTLLLFAVGVSSSTSPASSSSPFSSSSF